MSTQSVKTRKNAAPAKLAPAWLADVGLVRRAALTFAASVLAGAAMVWSSSALLQQRTMAMEQARQDADRAFKRFTAIVNERLQIRDFGSRFERLQGKGLIGDEQRLNWIEAIQRSQAQRGLLPIAYSIEPQQPLRLDGAFDLGDYQLRASRMTLHMELLHEMDLLNLLDDLKQGGGYFAVQDCSMKRGGMVADAMAASSLVADCTLNWVSLALPAAGAAATMPAPAAAPARKAGMP